MSGRRLPWWKEILLNEEYRERIKRLTTARYRAELRLLQNHPEQLAPAVWDDGSPMLESAQCVTVPAGEAWATRHPESVVKVSAFRALHTAAAASALSGETEDGHHRALLEEVRELWGEEDAATRLYGLSYIWNRPLPPSGFVRLWPSPLPAMWPTLFDDANAPSTPPRLPRHHPTREDALSVHVYREGGEHLGVWRQSLMLVRFKTVCWALLEEERQREMECNGAATPVTHRPMTSSPILDGVPRFETPLLRVQKGTTRYIRRTNQVDVQSMEPPRTWEGIAPAPTTYRAEQAYQNWHALHRSSTLVYQSVRDVFDLLPHDADGLMTKETYVEFVLDLLNLFFPTHLSATSIDIAEEEWVFRGTTELICFELFFEKFFSFPFILHRDLNTITPEEYAEVWCLIRVCLIETADTIAPCLGEAIPQVKRFGAYRSRNSASNNLHSVMRPVSALGATLRSEQKLRQLKNVTAREVLPLITEINDFTRAEISHLGARDFHNCDGYALHRAKQIIATEEADALRFITPSHRTFILHARGQELLHRTLTATTLAGNKKQSENAVTRSPKKKRWKMGKSFAEILCAKRMLMGGQTDNPSTSDEDGDESIGVSVLSSCTAHGILSSASLNSTATAVMTPTLTIHPSAPAFPPPARIMTPFSPSVTTPIPCGMSHTITSRIMNATISIADPARERRAALERLEEEQRARRLRETSVLYQSRRRRRRKEHAAIVTRLFRSHSGWELYHDDVFEPPAETLDAEDELLAFVQDIPDDFFDDPCNSLRERYAVHKTLLCARTTQRRVGTGSRRRWPNQKKGTGPITSTSSDDELESFSRAPTRSASPKQTQAQLTEEVEIPSVVETWRETGSRAHSPQQTSSWRELPIIGWSGCGAAALMKGVREMLRAAKNDPRDIHPTLRFNEEKEEEEEKEWDDMAQTPTEDTMRREEKEGKGEGEDERGSGSPKASSPLSSSSSSTWMLRSSYDEMETNCTAQREATVRTRTTQHIVVSPRRTLQLRLQAKRSLDTQYERKLQRRPQRASARTINSKAKIGGAGGGEKKTVLPPLVLRKA